MWKMPIEITAVAVCLAAPSCGGAGVRPVAEVQAESRPAADASIVVAASPGRVEGAAETLNLGIGIDGIIKEIRVAAGDTVAAGQVLATVDRDDLLHEERAAEAALQRALSRRSRLLRGARREVRRHAGEEVNAAAAVLTQAQSRFERTERLFHAAAAAAAERDEAKRDLDAASARVQAAEQARLLADAEPLPEETQQADAEVAEARSRLAAVRARREQAVIVAPTAGTILKVHLRPGGSVSPLVPQPVLTLADLTLLRVRAEVDERDVPNVVLGQQARIDISGSPVATGRVIWLAPIMGNKRTSTGDSAEKSDRDIRGVLVQLDGPASVVIDQRVTVQFIAPVPAAR